MHGRAPLAVAAITATPLFFAALMAATLAIEKPRIDAQWRNAKGTLISDFGPPPTWLETKIWLLAVAVSAIVLIAGAVGMFLPRGVLLAGIAGIAVPLALMTRVDTWAEHHTDRYRYGADLIRDTSISNILLQGEWEQSARTVAEELSWATVGLSGAAIAVSVVFEVRRRRRPPRPAEAVLVDAAGAPEVSPIPEP